MQSNVICDSGRDGTLVEGQPRVEPPRYKYAVKFAGGGDAPKGVIFADNLFHPGTEAEMNAKAGP